MASTSTNDDVEISASNSSEEAAIVVSVKDTASFFSNGTTEQFEHVLKLYPQVLKLKAEKRCKKPEELVRLDDWYQNELPKLIKKRGKDAHLIHEELVQCMKWKQTRGKHYPQLSYLVKVNTPRAVMMETKKAFKKLPNIEQAITALSNLKGVGTTMASALLAAACPEHVPFMADECLMAIPEIEGIDYTTKEYLNFVQHIQNAVNRLNGQPVKEKAPAARADKDDEEEEDDRNPTSTTNTRGSSPATEAESSEDTNGAASPLPKPWSPHKVELALWTHYVANELQPDLLKGIPGGGGSGATISSKFQQNGIDDDEETIPDGTEITATRRVSHSVGELEAEGSSSIDDGFNKLEAIPTSTSLPEEKLKFNGDDVAVETGGNGTIVTASGVLEDDADFKYKQNGNGEVAGTKRFSSEPLQTNVMKKLLLDR